jgi:hypothetical protein
MLENVDSQVDSQAPAFRIYYNGVLSLTASLLPSAKYGFSRWRTP